MIVGTRISWRKRPEKQPPAFLKTIPGGRDGLRALGADPVGAAEKHEDIIYNNVILSHCQAILDMQGTRQEKASRVMDYLLYSGVLEEPVSDVPRWRAGRFVHFRNLGYDKLQAVWAVTEQEGPGTSPKTVLRSLQRFRKAGGTMHGWKGEDFSGLPGTTNAELPRPDSMPDLHQRQMTPPKVM